MIRACSCTVVILGTIAFAAPRARTNRPSRSGARELDVCTASGLWGDVNDDGAVNVIDAQQVARYSVALSVANAIAVNARGDVTSDGTANVIDAQQIARYSVGLSASARINTLGAPAPTVATVSITGASSVNVGSALALTGSARDAGNTDLGACAPVSWSSSDPTRATVTTSGQVQALAPGTTVITASAAGKNGQLTITVVAGPGLSAYTGDNQVQTSGSAFIAPAVVQARNASNVPMAGVAVTFTVTTGGGTVSSASSVIVNTDANGRASVSWTPGSSAGAQQLTASATGMTTVTFNGTTVGTVAGTTRCELTNAGAAYCWGENTSGQIADGTTTNRNAPTAVTGALTFASLAEGAASHACGLTPAGKAWCWGNNDFGQLGDGTTTRRTSPVAALGSYVFSQLVVSLYNTCGRTTDGSLVCWGASGYGIFGDGVLGTIHTTPVPVVTGGLTFATVTLGGNHLCAVTTTAALYCWGLGGIGQLGNGTFINKTTPTLVSGGFSWASVSAGDRHSCAVTTAGVAYCWGWNFNGQLGINTAANNTPTPTAVSGGLTFSALSAADRTTCGRVTSGLVYCWGYNFYGQIGDATTTQRLAPVPVYGGITFTSIRARQYTTCGRATTGQPFCWGANYYGQVGDGTTTQRSVPTSVTWVEGAVGAAVAMSVNAGDNQGAAQGTSVSTPPSVIARNYLGAPVSGVPITFAVTGGGGSITGASAATNASGIATLGSWTLGSVLGTNTLTATSNGLPVVTFTATSLVAPASIAVAVGDDQVQAVSTSFAGPLTVIVKDASSNPIPGLSVQFAVITGNGTLTGSVSNYQATTDASGKASATLTAGSTAGTHVVTATVAGLPAVTFNARVVAYIYQNSRCELARNGAAYCWGDNLHGQIGDGTTTSRRTPTLVSGGLSFSSVADGFAAHVCALTSAGQAWCWGDNAFGQLGDGSTTDRSAPVQVSGGLTFTQLAVSQGASCGRVGSGAWYCWGSAGYGLYGDGALGIIRTSPTQLTTGALTFTSLALGGAHTCGIATTGAMYCWGLGSFGQLGTGTYANATTITAVNDGRTYASVAAVYYHTCALTTAGAAYCWGYGNNGQLGNALSTTSNTPVAVGGGLTFGSVAVGDFSSCGIVTAGQAYCWGANGSAQLGDGTTTARAAPVAVSGSRQFTALQLRAATSCGLTSYGGLFCWGDNSFGQIGDGTTATRTTPKAIPWMEGTLAIQGGNNQFAPTGASVSTPPSVVITDLVGPKAGVDVVFAVASGGGSITGPTQTTNASGVATLGSWTLGSSAGVNTVTATAAGVTGSPLTITATATSSIANLIIDGMYLTQSAQNYSGSVPLVANRAAFLRVFVRSDLANSSTPAVRVRFYNGSLIDTKTITAASASVVTTVNEGVLTSSWNVPVSASLIQPGLSILADVDPTNAVAESNETDNVFPASGTPKPIDVRTIAPFQATLVPILQTPNGLVGDVTEANKATFLGAALRLYPFPSATAAVHAPYSYSAVVGPNVDDTWGNLLSEMNALRTAEGGTSNYYGVFKPSQSGFTAAGLGFIGTPAAIGLDGDDGFTAAHEWGHNFGRNHVDCGGATGTDSAYPYAGGSIGIYGYDVTNSTLMLPTSAKDLMSYCNPKWISDYTYKAVMDFRTTVSSETVLAAGPGLLVWGRIGANGLVLEPAFEVNAPPKLPKRTGAYHLQGTDANGATLFDIPFDGDAVDHDGTERAFAFVIPLSATGARPATLALLETGRGLPVQRFSRVAPALSEVSAPSAIRAMRESPTHVRFEWDAVRYPRAIVRDAATGEILSFARNGQVVVSARGTSLNVTLSDGVRSVQRNVTVQQ